MGSSAALASSSRPAIEVAAKPGADQALSNGASEQQSSLRVSLGVSMSVECPLHSVDHGGAHRDGLRSAAQRIRGMNDGEGCREQSRSNRQRNGSEAER